MVQLQQCLHRLENNMTVLLDICNKNNANLDSMKTGYTLRFDRIEEKLGNMENDYSTRFNSIEGKLGRMEDDYAIRFNSIEGKLGRIEDDYAIRFNSIEGKLGSMEDDLSTLKSQLNVLSINTAANFEKVDNKLNLINIELNKIDATTRYEQEYQDMITFSRRR